MRSVKNMRKYIIIFLIFSVLLTFVLPFQFLLNFAHDDSFFYIKTANNFTKGLGSTFDGINISNGYHPLYFINLVILFLIPNLFFQPSPEFLYRLVVLYHIVIILVTQIFVFKSLNNIYKDNFNKKNFILLNILFISFVFIRDFGLESHLSILLISVFLYLKSKELIEDKDNIVLKSLIIACLYLTRTDYLFSYIPVILLIDYYLCSKKKKYILISISVLLITIFIYYLTNYIFFGNINTVSEKLLNSFPNILIYDNFKLLLSDRGKFYNQFFRIAVVITSLFVFLIFYFKKIRQNNYTHKYNLLLIGIGIGSVIFVFINLMFNNYSIREWYMTTPVFISLLMVGLIVDTNKNFYFISLFISVFLFLFIFYYTRIINIKYESGYNYAKTLKTLVNESESIYQIDYCGVVGFFSERKVINGDGFINSFEYLNYLKNARVNEYLKKYNVKYYSTYSLKNLLNDSVYIDDKYAYYINEKNLTFLKGNLVVEKEYEWKHITNILIGKWYLFKFY